jgi:hypothetical protein
MTHHAIIRQTLSALTVAVLAVAGPNHARAGGDAPKAPPPEVTALFDRMAGTWSAKEVTAQIQGRSHKGPSQVVCEKAPGGAVRCEVKVTMPGMAVEESDLFGWDPTARNIHMFAVAPRYAHEHVGTLDGDSLRLGYETTRDGKPFREQMSFTFAGTRELVWKDVCTLGGEVVFAGEGTYRK